MSITRALLAIAILTALAALPGGAGAALTDTGTHAPPTSGAHAYYATHGAFAPTITGFPGVGGTFVDPVFGSTIRRLTNEVGQQSDAEIYSRNGWFNADSSLVHHRAPNGRRFINTRTGQVVRTGVPGNVDSSFAADDPDAWYHWTYGSPTLMKYSVSSGQSSVVTTFPGALGELGGSVDWQDRSGRYMVLNVGGSIRVYDRQANVLYAGSLPDDFGGGWVSISPDGNYVLMSVSGSPSLSQSYRIDHGSQSVNTSPVTFWTLCGGHADVVSASNGKTYWVSLDCHSTGALYAVDVTIPQSAGNVAKQLSDNRRLATLTWSDDVHVSRVSRGPMRDWVVVSVESGGDGFTASVAGWYPFKQELFMVNVLTGAVQRLAHHRSRGDLGANYFWQPRVSASWDGSFIAWTSNFGHSQSGYADLYVIDTGVPAASVPGSGSSSSSSSSTTLMAAQLDQIAFARNHDGSYAGGLSAAAYYQQRFGGAGSTGGSSGGGPTTLSAAQLDQIAFARNHDGSYAGGLSAVAYYQQRFGSVGSSGGSSGGGPTTLSAAQLDQIAFARNHDGSYAGGLSAAAYYQQKFGSGGSSGGASGGSSTTLSAAQLDQIAYARNHDGSYAGGLSAAAYYQQAKAAGKF
ncbi:MAG TPA: hypothetical protein VEA38_24125 [Terriglobales bacterium]|nr:hypothetical protein [Terriglobales bacterium]